MYGEVRNISRKYMQVMYIGTVDYLFNTLLPIMQKSYIDAKNV